MHKEITLTQLADLTGLSAAHISMLVKRGEIMPGRKEGNNRFYPAELVDRLRMRGKRKKAATKGAAKGAKIQLEDLL